MDVLLVINELNRDVEPRDALLVINQINRAGDIPGDEGYFVWDDGTPNRSLREIAPVEQGGGDFGDGALVNPVPSWPDPSADFLIG